MEFITVRNFDEWRVAARALIANNVAPSDLQWSDGMQEASLFSASQMQVSSSPALRVPPEFLELARKVACHRDPSRWAILYRALWRIAAGERYLTRLFIDPDIHALKEFEKDVRRDMHKMKAFVRFRKVDREDGIEQYIAWHRPDHFIVEATAPFFARRFPTMNWSIFTPHGSVTWDLQKLKFGPGVSMDQAPKDDAMEEMWRTYYASIFNPARVNVAQMKREMPTRHWPTLPETSLIPGLLEKAVARVDAMLDATEGFADSAASYMPKHFDLASLAKAAEQCAGCELYCHATQTVFGEGPADARIVLVGEQPGDREDIEGRPFVGPAGQLLQASLDHAGILRDDVYITNAVKHFKFEPRGKQRLHKKPNAREVLACRPWLEAELSVIKPGVVVCLGATAAQALIGRDFRITADRGKILNTKWAERTIATWHPAAILRMTHDARRHEMEEELVADLASIASSGI